jgi:DNA-binding SARP family transcriptional activator
MGTASDDERLKEVRVRVTLLGSFTISLDGRNAGPWPRPSARRLCELLMLRPDHKLLRDGVREMLFANLAPEGSANALRRAVSMARQAISPLGEIGPRLLRADRYHISVPANIPLDIDLAAHMTALRCALEMTPGNERDAALSAALRQDAALLDDEPYSDWALEARDALELLRQRARLQLVRDRGEGHGRCQPGAVIDACEACLAHDPAAEDAAATLMRAYARTGQRQLVVRTYLRCRAALEELDLRPSSVVERAYQSAADGAVELIPPSSRTDFEWSSSRGTSLGPTIDLSSRPAEGRSLVRS